MTQHCGAFPVEALIKEEGGLFTNFVYSNGRHVGRCI